MFDQNAFALAARADNGSDPAFGYIQIQTFQNGLAAECFIDVMKANHFNVILRKLMGRSRFLQ